ncbi:MAG TPA: 16S rRNA (adenine(1518)-N(6)/adenine(1519)-N(6))-dimethyltransferase RsmA [Opitutaceae bacterium]|nr:16S rRNA (adenine(1518)-N(6)/adenine(1519)-N(6))-dimethyltransferase RsmA [Opitutaceae bacterium]
MPLTPTETRALLARLGHVPKRFLGQNFLVDGNIVRKSLALAALHPGDAVVEIGPGLGTLTAALLEAGAEVWAVEKDPVLHAHLAATLAPAFPGRLHLLAGDAVAQPLAGLPPDRADAFQIVANLPYAISTPWMDAVLAGPLPGRLVLMLQREAAERYAARPGTKDFGAISIFLQAAYAHAPGHRVPAGCFYPRPDVDSCLLPLERRPAPFRFSPPAKALIRVLFQQRRKQIGSLLRARAPEAGAAWLPLLGAAGLGPQARPEQIPVALWRELRVA